MRPSLEMTEMRALPYLLLAAGLLAGCPTATTDTGDKDTDTGGGTEDTDTGEVTGPDTGKSAFWVYGGFEHAQGTLQSAYEGWQFATPDETGVACDISATLATVGASGTCAQCDWSFELQFGAATTVGDGCGSIDTTWIDFTAPSGMGWADEYTYVGDVTYYDTDVVFGYSTTYGWYELSYNNVDYEVVNVVGDTTAADFSTFFGYVAYTYY